MTKKAAAIAPEDFFSALSDPTRLRLLNLMREDEICVCFFVEVLGTNQPKISRHLGYLRRAGLVDVRRDGKWMHYRLARPADSRFARIFESILAWMDSDPAMQHDREALMRACCSSRVSDQLRRAPKPAFADATR